jgi:hypothetical protein
LAINIGVDIGAIGLKLAALGAREDAEALEALCAGRPAFRKVDDWAFPASHPVPAQSPLAGQTLVVSESRRISGSPIQAAYELLQSLYDVIPTSQIEGIRVTGSGSRAIAKILGIYYENEFKATAHMVAAFYPWARTVFEIGGESSRYLRLQPSEAGEAGVRQD